MDPLYIAAIASGLVLFLAPFICFSCAFLRPDFDKKASVFNLYEPAANPTPYISSFEVKREDGRALLFLYVSKKTSFKALVFDKKGKAREVIRVSCLDPSFPCRLILPKDSSGVAFVDADPTKKVSFDMKLWKILVFPLVYGVCIAFGLFFIGYGACGIQFELHPTPNFYYPTKLAYFATFGAGVLAYLIAFLGLFFRFIHVQRKEGK